MPQNLDVSNYMLHFLLYFLQYNIGMPVKMDFFSTASKSLFKDQSAHLSTTLLNLSPKLIRILRLTE
jgi:hypothetical protein